MIGLVDEVILIPISSRNFYGDKIAFSSFEEKCRIKEKTQVVKNNENEEVLSSIELTFDGSSTVNIEMDIEYKGQRYPIISLSPKKHLSGKIAYKKVYA